MRRSLSLKRESLAALTTDEMTGVAGGSHGCTVGHGPSFDQACPTTPVNFCVDLVLECLRSRSCAATF